VASALPGEIVVVVESIVAEDLRVGIGTDVAGVIAEALSGETGIELLPNKRYANDSVAGKAELPDGSVGMLLSHRTRVKPKRASFTMVDEKV